MLCHFILGTRPEIIKLAPVIDAWTKLGHSSRIVHSGQHYDYEMDGVFFRELGLPEPSVSLKVGSLRQVPQTALILEGVGRVLDREAARLVVVQGDTNTTLGGALAAAKRPETTLAHVESGCRSFDRSMPEEVNRIVADHVSTCRFAATPHDLANLKSEGLSTNSYLVGSTGIESCLRNAPIAATRSGIIVNLSLERRGFALATVHRTGNTADEESLKGIMSALGVIGETLPVVFPVHPRTAEALRRFGIPWPQTVQRVPPLGYLDFLALLAQARMVLTDSGGVQEEAAALGTSCFTLRDETEWTFTLDAGANRLVGDSEERIVDAVHCFLRRDGAQTPLPPHWIDGRPPSHLIVRRLEELAS